MIRTSARLIQVRSACASDFRSLVGPIDLHIIHCRDDDRQAAPAVLAPRRSPAAVVTDGHRDLSVARPPCNSNVAGDREYACSIAFAQASLTAIVISATSPSSAPRSLRHRRRLRRTCVSVFGSAGSVACSSAGTAEFCRETIATSSDRPSGGTRIPRPRRRTLLPASGLLGLWRPHIDARAQRDPAALDEPVRCRAAASRRFPATAHVQGSGRMGTPPGGRAGVHFQHANVGVRDHERREMSSGRVLELRRVRVEHRAAGCHRRTRRSECTNRSTSSSVRPGP